ncbi:hypothetical protein SAMN05192558_113134 [Actinokineospora alba]|uniref:Uncharacterized protein n=1 Tax=Actinokineospora alba TaxID=504798 RepID=A0A1H0VA05_9PSEU|nr:hypothetical protein [Actinokineospora alba]TDP65581.1 hypothetical protein C8E96_1067 [Actinokineospora alba]SDH65969.1 hypothetical protein SAMN05421871_101888 [Actinokineospora alba]SDP75372.1 hypothetical protein SAMN05192558_113134 [Actinokineospora alba]
MAARIACLHWSFVARLVNTTVHKRCTQCGHRWRERATSAARKRTA